MTVRELNGWSPATVTMDADGNVVSVTVTEPRFSPSEVMLLLASRRQEKEPRGHHGLPLRETMDPKNQYAYVVPEPEVDFAQLKYTAARKAYEKANPDADMSAVMFRVERRDQSRE